MDDQRLTLEGPHNRKVQHYVVIARPWGLPGPLAHSFDLPAWLHDTKISSENDTKMRKTITFLRHCKSRPTIMADHQLPTLGNIYLVYRNSRYFSKFGGIGC